MSDPLKSNDDIRKLIKASTLKEMTQKSYLANLNTIVKYTQTSFHNVILHPKQYYPMIEAGANEGRRVVRPGRDTVGTVRTLIKTILAVMKLMQIRESDHGKEWYAYFSEKTDKLVEKADNNVPLSHNMTWDVIRARLANWPVGSVEHAVLSLYVEIPPRRQQDYWKLWLGVPNKTEDHTGYVVLKGSDPKIVVTVYKTSEKYEEWSKELPPILVHAIQAYLQKRAHVSKYLFAKVSGEPYASLASFTDANNTVIKRALDNPHASVNTLRHAAATMVATSQDLLRKEKKEWALDMGHSLSMQTQYVIASARATT